MRMQNCTPLSRCLRVSITGILSSGITLILSFHLLHLLQPSRISFLGHLLSIHFYLAVDVMATILPHFQLFEETPVWRDYVPLPAHECDGFGGGDAPALHDYPCQKCTHQSCRLVTQFE